MRDIVVLSDTEYFSKYSEILTENGYNIKCTLDETELYRLIDTNEKIFAVAVICNRENKERIYKRTIRNLKNMSTMNNKAIISILNTTSYVNLESLRPQDEFIIMPCSEIEMLQRVNKLHYDGEFHRKRNEEVGELFLMYEAMTKLVSTVFSMTRPEAEEHSYEVQNYTSFIATNYQKRYPDRLTESDMNIIITLSLLHDIGLIYIDKNLTVNHKTLTYKENLELRKHPLIGGQLFRIVKEEIFEKYNKTPRVLQKAIKITEYHHELYDGSGYPFGLSGEEIPLPARIIAIANFLQLEINTVSDVKPVIKKLIKDKENPKYDPDMSDIVIENASELKRLVVTLKMGKDTEKEKDIDK